MSHIKKIDLYKVPPRWLFLKLTTSDGIEGWGEPIVEGKADTVKAAVKEFSSDLVGKRAGNIERNDRPGLGVEIDEDKVKLAAREGHDWHNLIWRNEDGSITEW